MLSGALTFREEAWNAHPYYAKNIIRNPAFISNPEGIVMHTYCVGHEHNAPVENVHNLSEQQLSLRRVTRLDIGHVPELGHCRTETTGDDAHEKDEWNTRSWLVL